MLFDEWLNPLSERLLFSKNYGEDKTTVGFHTDKTQYGRREKVVTTLSLTPSPSGRVGEGHFSVAITDDQDIAVDSSTTILSSFLLTSELRGYIENPSFYLHDTDASTVALDYLMMTHGWRRYTVPDAVKGNPKSPRIPFQTSQEISGNVKIPTSSRPVTDSEVSILTRDGDFGITATDETGAFSFHDFEYPDSTSFYIQALGRRGSGSVELTLDGETFPRPVHAVQSPIVEIPAIRELTKSEPETNDFMVKAEQRARFDEDMWVILLDEVEITARRIERKFDEPRLQFVLNENSDVTIGKEEIERAASGSITVIDLIRKTAPAGVNVTEDGRISIRGLDSLQGGTYPLIIIDGVPGSLDILQVDAVASIDFFKGVGASSFGVRGANGVISITTKTGATGIIQENKGLYSKVYTPLGYQKPVEFYSPTYETLESKHLTIPDFRTTVFWKPDVVVAEKGEAGFEFYTSDFPTTYSVVIEGLTTDGRIIRQVEKIQVK